MTEIKLEDIKPGDRIRETAVYEDQAFTQITEFTVKSIRTNQDYIQTMKADGSTGGRHNLDDHREANTVTYELVSRPEYQPQNGDLFGSSYQQYAYYNGWLICIPDPTTVYSNSISMYPYRTRGSNIKLIKRADGEPV